MKMALSNYPHILPKFPPIFLIFDLSAFDQTEIPDISHGDGQSLQLWLAQTLGKDPAFLDPWGNEYVCVPMGRGWGKIPVVFDGSGWKNR